MLIALEIPAGVFKNGTDLMAKDRWMDASLVRFHESSLRPIGGWNLFKDTAIPGIVRRMISWRDNGGTRHIAAGSYNGLYAIDTTGIVSDITPVGFTQGFESATINTGYGGGLYGRGTYGTPRDDNSNYTEAAMWQLDTWGENLIGCMASDGSIYEWKLDTGTPAAVIPNAPINCQGVITSEERFLFALGADGNPRKVAWSDREDNTTWAATATNQAGDMELQTPGGIQQAVRTRGQVLFITDVDAHTATFTGGQAVYSFERVGESCGVISRDAAVSIKGAAFWMGRRGFYRFVGGSAEPLMSDVSDYVFGDINRDKASHVWGVANAQFGEIWWFYPSGGSTEIDRYVVYNYRENHWNIGSMNRTAGFDQGTWRYPMMFDETGDLFEHEFGFAHGDVMPFAETGPIAIGVGDQVMHVNSLVPDEEVQGDVGMTFKARFYPNGEERDYGPYAMDTPTDVRFTGRQVRMRIEGNDNRDWRVGINRIDVMAGGRR